MLLRTSVLLAVAVFIEFVSCGNYRENYQSFLNQSKYAWYDKRIRPVTNQSSAIDVSISLSLIGVNDLNAISGTLELVGILTVTWTNEILVFTGYSDWADIDAFFLPQQNLWRPSLVLHNSVKSLKEIGDSSYRIRIDNTGKHVWTVGLVTATSCSVDVSLFPFDTQSCEVTFTPWGFKDSEIELSSTDSSVDLTFYSESTEWKYLSSSVSTSTSGIKSLVTYTIKLQRNPGYYSVNIMMPVIVVAILNLLVFLLPAECGERVGYAVTIFLTFAVYLDLVTNTLPQSSQTVAKLSYYLISMVIMGAVTTLLVIISLWIYHRDEKHPIHRHIETLTNFITCKCGKSKKQQNVVKPISSPRDTGPLSPTNINVGDGLRQNSEDMEMVDVEKPKRRLPSSESTGMLIPPEGDDESEEEMDWHRVARAFDYLFCFLVFWVTFGLSCFYLVPLAAG